MVEQPVEGNESRRTGAANPVIRVRGAREHNLRDVDVDLPRNQLIVITGVSGSGKSSLAFDTLFVEGQRRYLESLSTQTRHYLDQGSRPAVRSIEGLPPTLAVSQRTTSMQARSTLATVTEIQDYLRLLYARGGTLHCYQCGAVVSPQSSQEIVDRILSLEQGRKVMIMAPVVRGRKGAHRELFERIGREGFVRARVDGEIVDVANPPPLKPKQVHSIEVVVDRIIVKEGIRPRLIESVETALKLGDGACVISHESSSGAGPSRGTAGASAATSSGMNWADSLYSSKFACANCQLSFPPVEPRSLSFNSPYGACARCEGLGLVADAADATKGRRADARQAKERRAEEKTAEEKTAERRVVCPECEGGRLGPVGRAVQWQGVTLPAFLAQTVAEAEQFLNPWPSSDAPLSPEEARNRAVAEKIVPEIARRLRFLQQVGLGYLTLNRPAETLSGGELQRARLAGCLGSGLLGVCYILDEPTVGLHPRDTQRLLESLQTLRDQGNTVIVVEHDVDVMQAADFMLDIGPGAGVEGGRLIATGRPTDVATQPSSVTGPYLNARHVWTWEPRQPLSDERPALRLEQVRVHNLQDVSVSFPLGTLTCVTGVSGSGKSTLVMETLVPAVRQALSQRERSQPVSESSAGRLGLSGIEQLDRLVEIDQSPLGRSRRSNPATATGLWDHVRRVFARTKEARLRGFTASRLSFNAPGGRCEECRGQGTRRLKMHFLPDLEVTCPVCRGLQFNRQTLQVRYRGKSVADVLGMRVDEAAEFFVNFTVMHEILRTLQGVGLGYLTLGQPATTLSGGEAQRVKLAAELSQHRTRLDPVKPRTLYVLDEPTTGLHPADVTRLLQLLRQLVAEGHSVIVIEHQLDVIAAADWIIDLGPDGGAAGGRIVAVGSPADIARTVASHTGQALARMGTIESPG